MPPLKQNNDEFKTKGGIFIQQLKQRWVTWLSSLVFAILLVASGSASALALLPEVQVGGQSIGVLLNTNGLTVVGLSPVRLADGATANPAADAGLLEGDFIVSVNGTSVTTNSAMSELVNAAGNQSANCDVEFVRNSVRRHLEVKPLWCEDAGSYRLGLYVRDNTAGVGTMTFWEPLSGTFGALGHAVNALSRPSEGENQGAVIRATVQGIRMGEVGRPGEKLGAFLTTDWQGEITKSGTHGVYGQSAALPGGEEQILSVAEHDQVEAGPATLFTVLSGETVESFSIEIVKLSVNNMLSNGGMVILVTDQQLLERTGGIIQGMSGSPIVQNGLLVGAVSHVFVNDPTQGYACYAEQMLEEAGLANQ